MLDKPQSGTSLAGESRVASATTVRPVTSLGLGPEGEQLTSGSNFDCIVHLIHCAVHRRLLVTVDPVTAVVWLPFTQLAKNQPWKHSAVVGVCVVLAGAGGRHFDRLKRRPPISACHVVQLLRLQTPVTGRFRKRLTVHHVLDPGADNFVCCTPVDDHRRLVWLECAELARLECRRFWGPEVAHFARLLLASANNHNNNGNGNGTGKGARIPQTVVECSLAEDAYRYLPRDPPRCAQESLLRSAHLTQTDVERLYDDFVWHTVPSTRMCRALFGTYMTANAFERDPTKLDRLFHTFDQSGAGFLSFSELLLGLAVMEPGSLHSEFRVRFILRYYDRENRGVLSTDELRTLVEDMVAPELVEEKLRCAMRECHCGPSSTVSLRALSSAVGSLRFRGTSVLCRASRSIFSQITRRLAQVNDHHMVKSVGSALNHRTNRHKILANVLFNRVNNEEPCPVCLQKKYQLGRHRVTFDIGCNQKATLVTNQLTVSRNRSAVSVSSRNSINAVPKAPKSRNNTTNETTTTVTTELPTAEQYSMECVFAPSSAANVTLSLVRAFAHFKGTTAKPSGLLANRGTSSITTVVANATTTAVADDLLHLTHLLYAELEPLLEREHKCQPVFSPCYIIGDIHGNLEDLLSLERSLWPRLPVTGGVSLLFLGDYVDRGKWGVECALYLFALKLLCPNHVTLLRGNHEVRTLQRKYSYYRECVAKYGERVGLRLWELTNQVFDRLPVCATVDDALFAAHGGIPHASRGLADLGRIQRVLRDPERQSQSVWEILWSDPCSAAEYANQYEKLHFGHDDDEENDGDEEGDDKIGSVRSARLDDGFVPNAKRGTAWQFNEHAATEFLRANHLTNIVRAHEVVMPGYAFHFGHKCATIFSSSHYCGHDNMCGLMLADGQRLRVITLDTVNNASATN